MALDGHSAVLWGNNIYVWGGKEDATGATARHTNALYSNALFIISPSECITKPTTVLQRLHLGGDRGSDAATLTVPRGRAYHAAALYGKLMLVTGGLTEETAAAVNESAAVPVFDFERRVWTLKATFGDIPCARCHHVSLVYGDTLFLHGGYPILSERSHEITADEMSSMQHAMYDVCELNIATMRWRRIQNAQSPALWGHSAVLYNRNVIVFGGVDVVENCESGAVAVWHTEKKQWRWSDFDHLDLRCAMHVAAVDGPRMFVFAGVSYKTQTKLRSLYEFNIEFGSWRELHAKGSQPLGRIGHAAVTYNQCMFIIGGSVENQNNPTLSGGRIERAVHVYNAALNEWRTCALVPASAADDNGNGIAHRPTFAGREQSWTSGALDPATMDAAGDSWTQTAHNVRDAIARAKAIQSLADSATGAVDAANSAAANANGGEHSASRQRDPREYSHGGGGGGGVVTIPFTDEAHAAAQRVAAARAVGGSSTHLAYPGSPNAQSMAQTDVSPAEAQFERVADLRRGVSNEESRRVIEHLNRENARLRLQLDDFRTGVARPVPASGRNPFEVPIYNSASKEMPTLPGNDVVPSIRNATGDDSRGAGPKVKAASSRLDSNTLGDYTPRLNLNAAEEPRAVAGHQGFMSRSAVSALVQASLNRDATTSSSLDVPPPNVRLAALDPMAFLTGPSAVAQQSASAQAWHPGQYAPPQTYEQLLARAHVGPSGADGGGGGYGSGLSGGFGGGGALAHQSFGGVGALPLALQPLMTILAGASHIPMPSPPFGGATPMMSPVQQQQQFQQQMLQQQSLFGNSTGFGNGNMSAALQQQQQQQQMTPSNMSLTTPGPQLGRGPSVSFADAGRNQFKSPSLSQVVSGQASMLSLPPSTRRRS